MTAVATRARETVQRMQAYTLDARRGDVKLNQNESPFDLPDHMKQRIMTTALAMPWNVYPRLGAPRVRDALSRAYDLPTKGIVVGNGSNELLAATIAVFVEPGVRVALLRPGFTLYEQLVAISGGQLLAVDVDPRTGTLPLDRLVASVEEDGADVVIVCSPNNPTGGVLPPGGLERLLATGAVVLFDRAYGDFDDAQKLPRIHERLVVFSTMSKAWGLAGLRIGWLYATPGVCDQIRKVTLPYSVNLLSEAIAVAAIEECSWRDATVRHVVRERDRVLEGLRSIPGIEPFPSRANFVAFRCLTQEPRAVFEALCARGVVIRDVSGYPGLHDALRVSIGTSEQNSRFLRELRRVMEDV